jgi:hypothetical protein
MSYKKWTPKQILIMKENWKKYIEIRECYWTDVSNLEDKMSKELEIDCEIFHCDNEACGIGSTDRTMELIPIERLEN